MGGGVGGLRESGKDREADRQTRGVPKVNAQERWKDRRDRQRDGRQRDRETERETEDRETESRAQHGPGRRTGERDGRDRQRETDTQRETERERERCCLTNEHPGMGVHSHDERERGGDGPHHDGRSPTPSPPRPSRPLHILDVSDFAGGHVFLIYPAGAEA